MSIQKEKYREAGDNSPAFFFERSDAPLFELTIWPNRSMPISGFRNVIYFTAAMLALPLIPLLGSPIGWALLPFLLATLFLLWFFIRKNYRDGRLHEVLKVWRDAITVERFEANGNVKRWHANPFWVHINFKERAKLENYLTLKGNGREIELGAFLSPEERVALKEELETVLKDIRESEA